MKLQICCLLLASGCAEAPVERRSTAEPLGVFSPALPDALDQQAWEVLASDARRREARFRDAVDPGYLFRTTRVDQAEIAAGLWSASELYEIGGQLFNLVFTAELGFGGKDLPKLARFHTGRRGGPDALSCASCHWRGGPAGGGDGADNAYLDGDGDRQSSALARNPPALVGLGGRERIAAEISADLAAQRDRLVAAARQKGSPLKTDLKSKGISFGWLGALPDGSLDTRGLEGVSEDLVVRPFGWKGTSASIRDVVEDELLIHHGMESSWLVATAGPERVGAFGGADPDGDGFTDEVSEGQVTALTTYLAMLEVPIVHMPSRADWLEQWASGEALFSSLGCAGCHVPSVRLEDAGWALPDREGGESLRVALDTEGAEPRLAASPDGGYEVFVFSDFKRHRMGSQLADPRPDRGVDADLFMTPPLWGLARSRPYLHDGRAPSVESAILAHGGEALDARNAYALLSKEDRYRLRLYLATLNRAPRLVSP